MEVQESAQQNPLEHKRNKMAEETKNKVDKEEKKEVVKAEAPMVESKKEATPSPPTLQDKPEEKKEEKKTETPKKKTPEKIIKKEKAIAKGMNLHASTKQCTYICNFIKNKPIDKAISDLEQVIKFKKPVPFKGEIPHRKGKGIMSGRYPAKASALLIKILKGLKGNVIVNGLEPEKTKIIIASANQASRPLRREGRQAKRTNIILEAMETNNGG
jgi:ribosomal protein L22